MKDLPKEILNNYNYLLSSIHNFLIEESIGLEIEYSNCIAINNGEFVHSMDNTPYKNTEHHLHEIITLDPKSKKQIQFPMLYCIDDHYDHLVNREYQLLIDKIMKYQKISISTGSISTKEFTYSCLTSILGMITDSGSYIQKFKENFENEIGKKNTSN